MWPLGARNKFIPLSARAKGTSNPLIWDIPKSGILSGIWLSIKGAVAGTLSAQNALGFSSIVRNVRVIMNSGIDLVNITGPGYHYLVRDQLESFFDPSPFASGGRVAITATSFDISMYLPIALNSRDPLGLVMLQNDDTQLQLSVEFEADATVATGATVTATVIPYLNLFTVPLDVKNHPSFDYLHTLREESTVVSGAGDVTWYWPRGNTYASIFHGLGIGASPADGFSRVAVRVNQSDYLMETGGGQSDEFLDMYFALWRGRVRPLGVIPIDLLGSSGIGTYGSARDYFDSAQVTDVASIITATGAGTLRTMKRELVQLRRKE